MQAGGAAIIGYRQYIIVNGDRIATISNVESIDSTDGDEIPDGIDNCGLVANPFQLDTDGDGFGNICDPDLNNDGDVDFIDLGLFQSVFFTDDEHADFDGSGQVNFADLLIFNTYFLIGPGPARSTELGVSIQYFHTDHLGSIDSMTDSDGVLIGEFSYDAFGQERDPTTWASNEDVLDNGVSWTATNRSFTDHELLRGVKLIHMNGRVYDPLIGRVISSDPFIPDPTATQSYNRFSYVGNNPLSFTDPSGFVTEPLIHFFCEGDHPLVRLEGGSREPGNAVDYVSIPDTAISQTPRGDTDVAGGSQGTYPTPWDAWLEDTAGFHRFEIGPTALCERSKPLCTPKIALEIVNVFSLYIVGPADPGDGPVMLIGDNPIIHYTDYDNLRSVNVTEEGHLFHEGAVVHQISETESTIDLTTVGVGIGDNPTLNEVVGSFLFRGTHRDSRRALRRITDPYNDIYYRE